MSRGRPGKPGPGDEPDSGEPVLAAARELAATVDGVAVDQVRLLRTLSGTWIAMSDRVVVKVHGPKTSAVNLSRRLRLAADPALRQCVLTPLSREPVRLGGGSGRGGPESDWWATIWPRVDPLPQDVAVAPWAQAGALLARLHRQPLPDQARRAPAQGSVDRLRGALARLSAVVDHELPQALRPAEAVVRSAVAKLPRACWDPDGSPGRPRTVVHGDWHLGQLGRLLPQVKKQPADDSEQEHRSRERNHSGTDGWRLLDVDDLGPGDPVWDLARPAAFWAAGLMPDADWGAFVESYRARGGPALPPAPFDPWPALDAVAQVGIVLAAAGAVRRAVSAGLPLAEMDSRLIEVCDRLPGCD